MAENPKKKNDLQQSGGLKLTYILLLATISCGEEVIRLPPVEFILFRWTHFPSLDCGQARFSI
jgi:hypothetical protein